MDPSLEFVITSDDITATGAPATLLIFNNEKGFSEKNIDSICSVGRSTKKGNRKRGYIGEKGMSFALYYMTSRQTQISKTLVVLTCLFCFNLGRYRFQECVLDYLTAVYFQQWLSDSLQ